MVRHKPCYVTKISSMSNRSKIVVLPVLVRGGNVPVFFTNLESITQHSLHKVKASAEWNPGVYRYRPSIHDRALCFFISAVNIVESLKWSMSFLHLQMVLSTTGRSKDGYIHACRKAFIWRFSTQCTIASMFLILHSHAYMTVLFKGEIL